MGADYYIGLDLGQASAFTAVAVLERPEEPDLGEGPTYPLRHLQRFPLGTPYGEIAQTVARLADDRPLRGNATLVADQTGVGRPVVDLFRRSVQARVVAVTITAGLTATQAEDGSRHVPKKDLVGCLQLLLQGRRLKVARSLPEADLLAREMANFQARITIVREDSLVAWREGRHDDLVLAVALACWLAEREPRWGPDAFSFGGDSLFANPPDEEFLT
jgi:hypothetical protein